MKDRDNFHMETVRRAMCSFIGVGYSDVDWNDPMHTTHHAWTIDVQYEFRVWMEALLSEIGIGLGKTKHIMSRADIASIVDDYLLHQGWEIRFESDLLDFKPMPAFRESKDKGRPKKITCACGITSTGISDFYRECDKRMTELNDSRLSNVVKKRIEELQLTIDRVQRTLLINK